MRKILIVFAIGLFIGVLSGGASQILKPNVVITEPSDGTVVNEPYITISGYASDEIGMDYWKWTWEWGNGSSSNSSYFEATTYYEFSIHLNLHEGWNLINVTFVNVNGIEGSDSVNITYVHDYEPPEIHIEEPKDGDIFTFSKINVTGSATDNVGVVEIGYIQQWNGGSKEKSWEMDATQYYSFNIELNLQMGLNNITVFARDKAGNEGREEIKVTYAENHPPAPPRTPYPNDGAELVDVENVELSWSCFDIDNDTIHYRILFEENDSTPDVNISWQQAKYYEISELKPNTVYYWQVIAYDNEYETASPIWSFKTRDISPPSAHFLMPLNGHLYIFGRNICFIGKTVVIGRMEVEIYANDEVGIYSVEFYVDDEIQKIDYTEPYSFKLIQKGRHEIKARIIDCQFNEKNISLELYKINIPCEDSYVLIWPARNNRTVGNIGDMVRGVYDDENFPKHFVSPVQGYNNDEHWRSEKFDYVVMEACIRWGDCEKPQFRWRDVPSNVTTRGTFAFVPRKNPGKYVLTAELVRGNEIVSDDTVIVWIVEAEIRSKDIKKGWFLSQNSITHKFYTVVYANINFEHIIKPSSILNDFAIPDLFGKNNISPPSIGGDEDVKNSGKNMNGGVNRKWDNSRQAREKLTGDLDYLPIETFSFFTFNKDLWGDFVDWPPSFPAAQGNDDNASTEEMNNPYINGMLKGHDRPMRSIPLIENSGWVYQPRIELKLHFREFTRLEIGKKWYRISPYFLWRTHFTLILKNELLSNKDWNKDGDKRDLVWSPYPDLNRGIIIETNHNGW